METEDHIVKLTIKSKYLHASDIRVINETNGQSSFLENSIGNRNVDYNLGFLTHLKDSVLLVQTVITEAPIDRNGFTDVEYTITYGDYIIQRTPLDPSNDIIRVFNLRFKFCPRFPFC